MSDTAPWLPYDAPEPPPGRWVTDVFGAPWRRIDAFPTADGDQSWLCPALGFRTWEDLMRTSSPLILQDADTTYPDLDPAHAHPRPPVPGKKENPS